MIEQHPQDSGTKSGYLLVARQYPIGDAFNMSASSLERVRQEAGLSQKELATRSGTSRSTLSAYEHGRKSPTLATVERLLFSAGFELTAERKISFSEAPVRRGRPFFAADRF